MAKNKSDSTIKFLIYILVFLIFVLVILLLFIIPSIKNYKSKKSDLFTYTSQNKHLSQKQVDLGKNIEKFKKEQAGLLQSFEGDFNKTDFIHFAQHYFSDVKVKEGQLKQGQTQFKAYSFSASSQAKTPVDLYKFIDALDKYHAIVKINFPITLKSEHNNIDIDFNMSVYKHKK